MFERWRGEETSLSERGKRKQVEKSKSLLRSRGEEGKIMYIPFTKWTLRRFSILGEKFRISGGEKTKSKAFSAVFKGDGGSALELGEAFLNQPIIEGKGEMEKKGEKGIVYHHRGKRVGMTFFG